MLTQTRNALIYSDLALFVLDSREGITYNDVALYKWLYFHQMKLPSEQRNFKESMPLSEQEKYQSIIEREEMYKKKVDKKVPIY